MLTPARLPPPTASGLRFVRRRCMEASRTPRRPAPLYERVRLLRTTSLEAAFGSPHEINGSRHNAAFCAAGLQTRPNHLKREVAVRLVGIDVAGIRGPIRQRHDDRLAGRR